MAWFTGANDRPTVKLAFGQSGTFAEPIIIDDSSPLGRVDVLLLDEETAVVSWLDRDEVTTIRYRIVKSDGSMSEARIVTQTSESRGSGFPQMTLFQDTIHFAWTHYEVGQEPVI